MIKEKFYKYLFVISGLLIIFLFVLAIKTNQNIVLFIGFGISVFTITYSLFANALKDWYLNDN